MPDDEDTYCRLCAEPTPKTQLISPDEDVAVSSKVEMKLSWINVDISMSNSLPTTICFSCFDLLERTWSFLHNVRAAQEKLASLLATEKPQENADDSRKTSNQDAGKPVDKDWEEFQQPKTEVKVELPENETPNNTDIKIDFDIKAEYQSDNEFQDMPYSDGFNSTDSDIPLGVTARTKKLRRKHKKYSRSNHKSVDIDISEITTTWADLMCRCAKCDAQCKNVMSLQVHSIHIHNQCCVFKCLECSKKFFSFKPFIKHARTHNKELKYCCEYCNKIFSSTADMKSHRSKDHANIFATKCKNCGSNFETIEELDSHLTSFGYELRKPKKDLTGELTLKCDQCNKEFKSRSNLLQHKLVHTERSRDFSCHICGKMFFTKGTLGTHMMTHEETKPFKCEYCPLAFRARGNLQSHISLHSGTKPFVCEQCGKSFRVKRHLKSHSIVHTDLMPFTCQYCNKTFRFKTRLNLHLRQHTGAKPYKCIYCQRDFTNGSNFKKHMKRRHGIDTSKEKYDNIVPKEKELL